MIKLKSKINQTKIIATKKSVTSKNKSDLGAHYEKIALDYLQSYEIQLISKN